MRATILTILTLCGAGAAQDSMQLSDGRFVIGPKMTPAENGGVVIHFEHGDVLISKEKVRTCTALDAAANDANWSDADKAKLERGLVEFEGRWMKPEDRDALLEKRREELKAKIEEARAHQKWANRYVTETEHFRFEYTIDQDTMAELMEMMEVYFKTFTKGWRIKKPSGLEKLTVRFYHDEDYYYQVSGAPRGAIGFYRFVEPRELNFYYDRQDRENTIDVMFHETNHYLTHLIDLDFRYPSWVNESLAEYYGASSWDPKRKQMEIGHLQEGRLASIQDDIRDGEWQGLEDLMRTEQGQFTAGHYAWGWSLVHFLMSNRKYEKKFQRFYVALARDDAIERESWHFGMRAVPREAQIDAFKKYLGVRDLKDLEKEWHEYVKGLEAASHRGYTDAGWFALMRGMPLKAQRFLRKAIELGSDNPHTYMLLGRALVQREEWAEAAEQFGKAAELDPLEGWYYVHQARALQRTKEPNRGEIQRLRLLAGEVSPDDYRLRLMLDRMREREEDPDAADDDDDGNG